MLTINVTWPMLLTGTASILGLWVSALAWVRRDLKDDIHRLETRIGAGLTENRQLIIKYIAKEK